VNSALARNGTSYCHCATVLYLLYLPSTLILHPRRWTAGQLMMLAAADPGRASCHPINGRPFTGRTSSRVLVPRAHWHPKFVPDGCLCLSLSLLIPHVSPADSPRCKSVLLRNESACGRAGGVTNLASSTGQSRSVPPIAGPHQRTGLRSTACMSLMLIGLCVHQLAASIGRILPRRSRLGGIGGTLSILRKLGLMMKALSWP
jgi:hypothetical protein